MAKNVARKAVETAAGTVNVGKVAANAGSTRINALRAQLGTPIDTSGTSTMHIVDGHAVIIVKLDKPHVSGSVLKKFHDTGELPKNLTMGSARFESDDGIQSANVQFMCAPTPADVDPATLKKMWAERITRKGNADGNGGGWI